MNIAIIGLGLTGGSLAKTLKRHGKHQVYGYDIDGETMRQAQLLGALDGVLDDATLKTCDVTLVALYPAAIIEWIGSHAHLFKEDSLVIDCGGVKGAICEKLREVTVGATWHFIGGHPMAGREYSGFRYAQDDLFEGASMILAVEGHEDPAVLQRARSFFLDMGFRRVQFASPAVHDEMIAYTSQLAHIVSSAYVKCPLADKHRGFSAGSFDDMTRVARLTEEMWTELFFANGDALLPELEGLIDRLSEYRDALRNGSRNRMKELLRDGRETKESLGK